MTNAFDNTYLDLMRHVLAHGVEKSDRTGTGTRSVFGYQMRFDLRPGFPLLTTKKMPPAFDHPRTAVVSEGRDQRRLSQGKRCHHLGRVGRRRGKLGPVYGYQWRSWPAPDGAHIDQISEVLEQIKSNPDSRRLIVSAWNVADIPKMALAPCHALFQFYVADGKLSCQLYQRSADIFLGVPFNIASYALLTMMVAQVCGSASRAISFTRSATRICTAITSSRRANNWRARRARCRRCDSIRTVNDLFAFKFEDFTLENYDPHPAIKAPIAV